MAEQGSKPPEILLESGTNELEIIEFCIGNEYYGINVTKVREIIRSTVGIVPVPDAETSVAGVINLRGRIIPVVHLAKHLGIELDYDKDTSRIIVSEFNKIQVGFWVSHVTRIHRLSWMQVEAPSGLVQSKNGYAVGVIKIEGRIIFLLDFEKISSDINPDTGIQDAEEVNYQPEETSVDRSTKKIAIAEDSPFIRQLLVQYAEAAGYKVRAFGNGLEAWNALEQVTKQTDFEDISHHYNLLITDIEMPQMDGLHLIKRIKENLNLRKLPCVVFSSMITKELEFKCQAVGASDQISKPEIDRLVEIVDGKVI